MVSHPVVKLAARCCAVLNSLGCAMRERELKRLVLTIEALTWIQRGDLIDRLRATQAGQAARGIVGDRSRVLPMCPHCQDLHVVRNGQARGLQRYKCRDCGKTFNALTSTPLARLRHRDRWLGQAQALLEGLSITKAAERLDVARSTAFRWRHRFLAFPRGHQGARTRRDCRGRRDLLAQVLQGSAPKAAP